MANTTYTKGDRVVIMSDDDVYYLATVTQIRGGNRVCYRFDDNTRESCLLDHFALVGKATYKKARVKPLKLDNLFTVLADPKNAILSLVKQDPRIVNVLNTDNLVKLLKHAKDAYYNTGKSLISDKQYDVFEDMLRSRDPSHPLLTSVGAPVKKGKVELPYKMPSLDKMKTDAEINKWSMKNTGEFVVSDKIDGVSLLIVSDKGQYSLYSRGNGVQGQTLSHMAEMLSLPKTTKSFAARAEIAMKPSVFKLLDDGENPRNKVAGLLNRKTPSSAIKKADIIAYSLFYPNKKPSDQLRFLKSVGFNVVPYKVIDDVDFGLLSSMYKARLKKSEYEIDGLVVSYNRHEVTKESNPKFSIAFKETQEDSSKQARVTGIEWQLSRYGQLIPVVLVDAI